MTCTPSSLLPAPTAVLACGRGTIVPISCSGLRAIVDLYVNADIRTGIATIHVGGYDRRCSPRRKAYWQRYCIGPLVDGPAAGQTAEDTRLQVRSCKLCCPCERDVKLLSANKYPVAPQSGAPSKKRGAANA